MTVTETRQGELLFNFQDADIRAVAQAVAQITGYNIMLDPKVKGRMTVISSTPVSKAAAYQIFLSALKGEGLAAANGPGGVVTIFPEARALQRAPLSLGRPADSARWVTQVVAVKHGSASQIATLVKPLMEPNAPLSVYVPANTLIITAPAAQIRNLIDLVSQLDRANAGDVQVIPLKNASAVDMAQTIARLPDSSVQIENRLTVVPDVRTNALLVRADNPERVAQLRRLVLQLDVPAKEGGQARVIYLRYADAVKLADVLRGMLGVARGAAAASTPPTAASLPSYGSGQQAATAASPSAVPAPLSNPISQGISGMVQADEASNALIVSASDGVYNNLRSVVEKLDVPRAQLFVEALVAEVTLNRSAQFGVQWAGGKTQRGGAFVGLQNFPDFGSGIVNSAINPKAAFSGASGLSVGFLGRKITLPDGTQIFGLGALARALQSDSSVNILSTPELLTLDNSEARIMVGQNVPFLTGQYAQATGAGASVNPFQTIQRQDVGLTLKIRPQITEGGTIKLQIYQEISSIVPPTPGAVDLVTNKRSIETTVSVEHGQMIALGGLIQDNVTERVDAVPILSRIPLLGELFKYRSRSKNKVNLMVFLRPIIISTPREAGDLSIDRYDYIKGQEQQTKEEFSPFIPRYAPPIVPNSMVPVQVVPTPPAARESGAAPQGRTKP